MKLKELKKKLWQRYTITICWLFPIIVFILPFAPFLWRIEHTYWHYDPIYEFFGEVFEDYLDYSKGVSFSFRGLLFATCFYVIIKVGEKKGFIKYPIPIDRIVRYFFLVILPLVLLLLVCSKYYRSL